LTALYGEVEAELRALGASCEACGRCCRFAEFGHELWLTNVELDYLQARHGHGGAAPLGVCPYLDGTLCSARAGRALACRTFHCCLAAAVVEEVTNRSFEKIRDAARAAGVDLEYTGLSALLRQAGANPCTNL
jgi:Fe-S-cluster containining protein